ncbi:hypothetical protein L2E82_32041 [Cichorium intybus]|uniref:Uncharacterized protein n=1 Tax=Cichorium intybus TaxID=13427 RepID=A0ACB9BHL2_CICIN|nr:hypothetical protein L2E82_32041 [Cichorium intybus]
MFLLTIIIHWNCIDGNSDNIFTCSSMELESLASISHILDDYNTNMKTMSESKPEPQLTHASIGKSGFRISNEDDDTVTLAGNEDIHKWVRNGVVVVPTRIKTNDRVVVAVVTGAG